MPKVDAQLFVYAELDRMYPPEPKESEARTMSAPDGDSGQIQGLSAVPEEWPELPANASLSTEIGWVQANRKSDQTPPGYLSLDCG